MGCDQPFLHKLTGKVAEMMRGPYPELPQTVEAVSKVIEKEEESFFHTIDSGLALVDKTFTDMRSTGRVMVAGREACDLYQTHGFPPELFETMAAEHNFTFDWIGLREELARHGEISNAGEKIVFTSGPLDALKKAMHGSKFLGYETTEADGKVIGLIAQDKLCDAIDEIGHAKPVVVVLDETPFY